MTQIPYSVHDNKAPALANSVSNKMNLMWQVSISLESGWWKYKSIVAWMNAES